MSVDNVTSVVRTVEDLNTQRTTNNSLGKDDFLKILVAQMGNQNPMEPTSDTDFIAQLAQFSALEQMQSLNAGFMRSQAYSLIGKTVYVARPAEDGSGEEVICGRVDGVVRQDGIDYLMVGQELYAVSEVTGVIDDTAANAMEQQILQSSGLIGKTVTASIKDEDGEVTTVVGEVEKIIVDNGEIFAVVDGTNVPLLSIEQIEPQQTEQ